jgi:chemotaxis protein histidine kinase CheA
MGDFDDIVKEFLAESYENLDRLDRDLVELEKHPSDRETLASIFRTIHTIKGTSGFLAFGKLEAVTHVGESLLARLRDGQLRLGPEITTALLAMVDAVRQMLEAIGATGADGGEDYQELIGRLKILQDASAESIAEIAKPAVETVPPAVETAQPVPAAPPPTEATKKFQPLPGRLGGLLLEQKRVTAEELALALEDQEKGNTRPLGEILVGLGALTAQELQEALKMLHESRSGAAEEATIRVRVAQLDRLMNLVGELVLARNRIQQWVGNKDDSGLLGTSQRLNLITTELQEGVMKTRMQPIGNIWSKFPRTVRDVALGCGKQIRIEMEGKETELDKTIIEAIKDPLTHLVRNAVDHGIEPPEERVAAGKSPEGRLLLRAFHEGGQVNIEIADDGAGLNLEKIRSKAVQKGVVSADQAARMSAREISNLIFLPGFSTAEKVTNVSGRGVGMDVVRTNIEKIGGMVEVQSKAGQGSTVRMKIPLTLAIIPALLVTSGGERYAIPQVSLLELVGLDGDQSRTGIEMIHGAPVYRLRGRLLPLVYLNRELQVDDKAAAAGKRGLLDFDQARNKHEQWLGRLRQLLDGHTTMTVEQAGSHTQCDLGKWLYATALHSYGGIGEIHKLEAMHKHFHQLVRGVVARRASGEQSRAEQELGSVALVSKKIIELLTVAEKKVLAYQNLNLVVLEADEQQFGLVVDEINDTEEIVVKPLSKHLKNINVYAGATIMGDGKVALILDVLGLAQRANVVSEVRDRAVAEKEGKGTLGAGDGNKRNAVLLFQYGEKGRMAIDLSLVARLEEFPRASIEIAGDQEVVQYRGQIMPLVRVSEILATKHRRTSEAEAESLQVVVYADQGRRIGLVIERILDIVDESFVVQRETGRKGVLGSALIQQRITDILNVPELLQMAGSREWQAAAAHA